MKKDAKRSGFIIPFPLLGRRKSKPERIADEWIHVQGNPRERDDEEEDDEKQTRERIDQVISVLLGVCSVLALVNYFAAINGGLSLSAAAVVFFNFCVALIGFTLALLLRDLHAIRCGMQRADQIAGLP
ncbi:unnamed protein product [Cuscuta campestris]|uniref:Uncharacterized protein n=1 Tax=Cuscuta campestris TaxID=132261 RepID=A0A484MEU8_9ASTE|nr:unnamed protein product [Cuscuta campestris]